MCSSSSSSSTSFLFLLTNTSSLSRRHAASIFTYPIPNPNPFLRSLRATNSRIRLVASVAERELELSWLSPGPSSSNNDYGGWAVVETPVHKANRGLPPLAIAVVGTSFVVLVATIAHFSLSKKGLRLQFGSPLHALHGILSRTETKGDQCKIEERGIFQENEMMSVASPESSPDSVTSASADKLERVVIPIPVDSAQEEALSLLKKLKIIEDDIKAHELCTRREYARWLVQINSSLERNPKHHIVPAISLSGATIAAFDDVSFEDPDFESIQVLAEAGVVASKLSQKNSDFDGPGSQENLYFSPERFVSRKDLINWKAKLEYNFMPAILEQISNTKVGFMDMKEIGSDASPELFMDVLAGEKSIIRRVFGQSKRFQPNKPVTKAQAAVALAGGRMTKAIYMELSRLEADSSARKVAMEEIKIELLDRGEIQRFWDGKLNEEIARGFEVEKVYFAAVNSLEEEKKFQEKKFSDNLKEKAAMDCQRQLILSLKEEVDEMSEKLASEREVYVAEQCNVQIMLSDLQNRREGRLDMKSALEAEKEAIRILRTWVEDEARKSKARAKVLEEVGRRWKWDNQAS